MNQDVSTVLLVLLLGFCAGILSGMFGIGGGLVIVPVLVILFQTPMKTATGTSLYALLWPVGLLGVFAYWRAGQINIWYGTWIAVGIFLGAFLGAQITLALPAATMRRCYAVFLLAVGAYFLVTTRSEPASKTGPAAGPPREAANSLPR
jgi:uncharacterized membrane protein YfcA